VPFVRHWYWFVSSQVDVDEIVERHRISTMLDGIKSLSGILQDWLTSQKDIPEVDWSKIRLLDFQETLQRRNTIVKRNSNRGCLQCPSFIPHVCVLFTASVEWLHHTIVYYYPWRADSTYQHCSSQTSHIRTEPGIDPRLWTTHRSSQGAEIYWWKLNGSLERAGSMRGR